MHGSKLPLTVWFWASYLMATHSNGISARQIGRQLGLGSYKSAWLLCAKLRRAMVSPARALSSGLVEVDETQISWVHRVFSNLKTWALGVYHGLRRKDLQSYLDKFVFRFNRRGDPRAAFRTLLGIGAAIKPVNYKMSISPEPQG